MIRSPFPTESFEPRFVIEDYRQVALAYAIDLWLWCDARFTHHAVSYVAKQPSTLRICAPSKHEPYGDEWERVYIPLAGLATWAMKWLETATYDGQPNFDGGEARGFAVFNGYYLAEGLQQNMLYVTPKWIEIHK